MSKSSSFVMQRPGTCRTQFRHCASAAFSFSLGSRLGLRILTKDFHQAVRDYFVLAILKLPHGKTEAVRIAGSASSAVFAHTRTRIAPTHATRPCTHAPNSDWPCLSQLLRNRWSGSLNLPRVNL